MGLAKFYDEDIIEELERRGYEVHKKSRNYITNELYHLLCDRFMVSYHTPKLKIVELVDKELSI